MRRAWRLFASHWRWPWPWLQAREPSLGSECEASFQESQIIRIFGTMINQKLQDFEEEVKPIGNVVTEATLDVYNTVVQRFLPTPAKIHYLFNLRDISKVGTGPRPCFDLTQPPPHFLKMSLRGLHSRAREMAQRLTVLATLSEALGLVPSTCTYVGLTTVCNSSSSIAHR